MNNLISLLDVPKSDIIPRYCKNKIQTLLNAHPRLSNHHAAAAAAVE